MKKHAIKAAFFAHNIKELCKLTARIPRDS